MWNSDKFINNASRYLSNVYLVNVYFCGFRPRSSLNQAGVSPLSTQKNNADLMVFFYQIDNKIVTVYSFR